MRGHRICDDLDVNAILVELPCREPGTLKVWPRLADDDTHPLSCIVRRSHDPECRSVAARRKGSRVAVCEDRPAVGHELGAECTELTTRRDLGLMKGASLLGDFLGPLCKVERRMHGGGV